MARFDFAVPSVLTFSVEADTEEEALDQAQEYVDGLALASNHEGTPAPPGNDDVVEDPTWTVLDDVELGDLVDNSVRDARDALTEDVAFDDAADVRSIIYRLHPLDVGFDLRSKRTVVQIDPGDPIRVSYPDERGARRVMAGPRGAVIARLRSLGFEVEG